LNINYADYKTPKKEIQKTKTETLKILSFFSQQPKIPQKNKNPPTTRMYLLGVNHDGVGAVLEALWPMSVSTAGLDSPEGSACSFSTAIKKKWYKYVQL
jgi:hypothetical protein